LKRKRENRNKLARFNHFSVQIVANRVLARKITQGKTPITVTDKEIEAELEQIQREEDAISMRERESERMEREKQFPEIK
jgi:hypothetical protein